jgi:hypothetical protein
MQKMSEFLSIRHLLQKNNIYLQALIIHSSFAAQRDLYIMMHLFRGPAKSAVFLASTAAIFCLFTACSDQAGKNAAASIHNTLEKPEIKIKEANDQHQKQLEAGIDAANQAASAAPSER